MRFQFLNPLYEKTGGDKFNCVIMRNLDFDLDYERDVNQPNGIDPQLYHTQRLFLLLKGAFLFFAYTNPYLVLMFSRTVDEIKKQYGKKGISALNDKESKGIVFIQDKKEVTKKEYAEYFQISGKTAQRHLSKFSKLGIVKQDIKGPATVYTFQQ